MELYVEINVSVLRYYKTLYVAFDYFYLSDIIKAGQGQNHRAWASRGVQAMARQIMRYKTNLLQNIFVYFNFSLSRAVFPQQL